ETSQHDQPSQMDQGLAPTHSWRQTLLPRHPRLSPGTRGAIVGSASAGLRELRIRGSSDCGLAGAARTRSGLTFILRPFPGEGEGLAISGPGGAYLIEVN